MRIRTKMLSLFALLFVVLSVLEIAIQSQVLMPRFVALERDAARTSMKRIEHALDTRLDGLALTAADWGNWEDVYQFVHAPTARFLAANITPVAMKQLQLTLLMIVDLQGNLLLSNARDVESGRPLDFEMATRKALPADFPWRRHLADGIPAQGLLETERGPLMIAAAPILDGSGTGQAIGMVIVGRLLDTQVLGQIASQAQVSLAMTLNRGAQGGERLDRTDRVTRLQRSFSDIYGRPLMDLRVDVAHDITERGQRAVTYASVYLIGAGIAVLLLAMSLLNRIVLEPLARVTRHAVAIGDGADLTARLNLPGDDEVARLAREFDRMVGRVEATRRELVDRSFQSGFAELAKGVLHNLGNAMTPLGVRLSSLGGRLLQAPIGDLELAFGELAHEPQGSARHADLENFVRLGCRELCLTVQAAQADFAVIQRQTTVVQAALGELLRSTHTEQVVEAVRLPELVSQTLEIVPDECRRRLAVEADESLHTVGVVRVARTVLRQVLQNFVINAAEAVRDAGRDRGVLRVAAEIVREGAEERLHLRCEDDGVGIAQEDLSHVFEQGFSTKSRETNYGIGLHWCANAIAALGGTIWAVSAGRGQGTALHLMLPLDRRSSQ